MKTSNLLIALLAFTIFSCNSDDDYSPVSTLDIELESALIDASDNIGTSFYTLPNSDDFSSIPQDPNNLLTEEKVKLGKLLFHETGLATEAMMTEGLGTYSCASCHHAAAGFQAGKRQGIGDGGIGFGFSGEGRIMNPLYTEDIVDFQPIKTPTALNTAYQKLMLWNGQFGATDQNIGTETQWTPGTPKETNNLGFEGVETQAIAGLTVHRMGVNEDIVTDLGYKDMFDEVFGDIPVEERYTIKNAGLAIAAYERTLLANEAPFQLWLKGDRNAMTENVKKGALLFFGKAQCFSCHNGPSLGSMEFSAIGINDLAGADIMGSVDDATKKGRGGFTLNPEDDYKFKVPQLYSIVYNGSYGHGASFNSIADIITYKNGGIKENENVPNEAIDLRFVPLDLTEEELSQLTQFIEVGLNDNNLSRYAPDSIMSGNCFPNNDEISSEDLGCN